MEKLKLVFAEAVAVASPGQRAAYLDAACTGDPALRTQVESLLTAREQIGDFLETPLLEGQDGHSSSVLGTQIGPYKILEEIGEGGFGIVYMAEQQEPVRRKVALKIIKAGMDTKQVIARFEAERQALAMMDHPNIARVLDAGETGAGRPYFVMELVKGIPITEFCDQKKLATRARIELFTKVCNAVQHAHQKGIIHRDLKPSNVMITMIDGQPVPKVIDFGVAKAIEQRLTEKTLFTRYDQLIGTPAYMSPEQAELSGQDVDTRSDIYSLGGLLYELLTSAPPIDAETLRKAGLDEIRRLIRETDPPKPSTRLRQTSLTARASELATRPSSLSTDLDWIVMKCLEKDRSRRYATVSDLAADLQRHLSWEPVTARPPGNLYRFQKFVRRNKGGFATATAVLLVLMLGTIVSSWQAIRATRLRGEAEQARANEKGHRIQAEQEASRAAASKSEARHLLYLANMNLAQQAWEQNNLSQVRQLLEETAAYPQRGFEWFHWQRQLHRDLLTIQGHLSAINCALFSPDSQFILTASWDRTAKVWHAATGKELLALEGHTFPVWSADFSPDGKRIVTGSWDQTAKLWDAATGELLLTLDRHEDQVVSVSFSPDGRRIVTASEDRTARIWDAASGEELYVFEGHRAPLAFASFSPDGRRILTGGWDETVKLWDAASGDVQVTLSIPNSGNISSGKFSPGGERIVTSSHRGIAKVWDAATGQELLSLNHSAGSGISSAAFTPDGRWILTGGDPAIKIWDAATGFERFTIKGHTMGIWAAAFSPDSRKIVSAAWDDTVKVWDISRREYASLIVHGGWVRALAFSPDGQRIASSSTDRTVKVWETSSGQEILSLSGHNLPVRSLAFSPDGSRILTGSEDHTAKVWDADTGQLLRTLSGHGSWIRSVAFFSDGSRVVTASDDQTAKIWNTANGELLLTLSGHRGSIRSVAVSLDGRRIATGSDDFSAKVWDVATGAQMLSLLDGEDEITSVAFSPDGRWIFYGSYDSTGKVSNAISGERRLNLTGHRGVIWSGAFSPDGQRILTASEDRTVKLWDITTGKEVLTLGHFGTPIWAAAFSPDGQRIAHSEGGQIKVWAAASTAEVAAWQERERDAAEHLAMSKRQKSLADAEDKASRACDPGAIKQWLVLLPIAYEDADPALEAFHKLNAKGITLPIGYDGRHAASALNQEQITNESRLRPRAGERVKLETAELTWKPIQLDDYIIQFDHLSKGRAQRSIAYAVSYIQSAFRQSGLLMEVGCDDRAKVYLNGKLLYHQKHPRDYNLGYDIVTDVELNAGTNVLLFKVVNEDGPWLGSIRITDSQRNPVKGIKITLDPD